LNCSKKRETEVYFKHALLVCSLSNVLTRGFNASCGETFILSNFYPSAQSLSIDLLGNQKEAINLTSDNIEFQKFTTALLHTTIPSTSVLSKEWKLIDIEKSWGGSTNTLTASKQILIPYENSAPELITITISEDTCPTTVYATLTVVPDKIKRFESMDGDIDLTENIVMAEDIFLTAKANSTHSSIYFGEKSAFIQLIRPGVTTPLSISPGKNVFRLYPQNLNLGYCVEIDSDVPANIFPAPRCLKEYCGLEVEQYQDEYLAMRKESWNIVFRSEVLTSSSTGSDDPHSLYVMFHLFDIAASPYFHVYIINNKTNQCSRQNLLTFVVNVEMETSYSIVIECNASHVDIPSGKWQLVVASDLPLQPIIKMPILTSMFTGIFTPNKHLTFFRDIFTPDDSKVATSTCIKLTSAIVNAAVKLEIFDRVTGMLLMKNSGYTCAQIMHLPEYTSESENAGYIIQGSFDGERWIVPDALQSIKPFYGIIKTQSSSINSPPKLESNLISTASVSDHTQLEWTLEIFTLTNIRLTPDCTILNKYAAIRNSWEQVDAGRETRGIISRMLYLGKRDEAIEKMTILEYTPEQQKEMLSRYDFLLSEPEDPALKLHAGETGVKMIHQDMPEVVLGEEFFISTTLKISEQLNDFKALMEQTAKERVEDCIQRKSEFEILKKDISDLRNAYLNERKALWTLREEIREQSQHVKNP